MEATFSPKRGMTFNGRHGVIFLKIELFIVTNIRTLNPANPNILNISEQRPLHENILQSCE
jgi:hypothetical protein